MSTRIIRFSGVPKLEFTVVHRLTGVEIAYALVRLYQQPDETPTLTRDDIEDLVHRHLAQRGSSFADPEYLVDLLGEEEFQARMRWALRLVARDYPAIRTSDAFLAACRMAKLHDLIAP